MRVLLILPLLAGCMASAPHPMYAQDGEPAYHVECRRSMDYCYDAAQQQCPKGYSALTTGQQTGTVGMANASGGYMGPMRFGDLTFRCK